MNEEFWKMLSKFDRRRSVSSAALMSNTRSALSVMVEKEARKVGSRTLAYENVGQMIGASSSWVRKYLAARGEVAEPRTPLFHKIRIAYDNLCERVEQQNRNDELRLRAIRKNLDAITDGFDTEGLRQNQAALGGS